MKRVVVIGGRGFVGRRTVRCLGRVPGVSVTVASRSPRQGEVRVDLEEPGTFPVLDSFHCVVDCADTVAADPAGVAEYCLERGLLFLETAAWAPRIRELLALRGHPRTGSGTVVVGVGLFPGVSNLLAADVMTRVSGCQSLDVGIRLSPLSGAGRGVSRLMAHQVCTPGYRVQDGREVGEAAIADRTRLTFPTGPAHAWRIGLAEPAMIRASTGISEVATYLAPMPALLGPALALFGRIVARAQPAPRWSVRLVAAALSALRGGLLRRRITAVELVAIAGRRDGDPAEGVSGGLQVSDGMEATACATAAFLLALLGRPELPSGVLLPDEVVGLDEALDRLEPLLAASGVTLRRPRVAA